MRIDLTKLTKQDILDALDAAGYIERNMLDVRYVSLMYVRDVLCGARYEGVFFDRDNRCTDKSYLYLTFNAEGVLTGDYSAVPHSSTPWEPVEDRGAQDEPLPCNYRQGE